MARTHGGISGSLDSSFWDKLKDQLLISLNPVKYSNQATEDLSKLFVGDDSYLAKLLQWSVSDTSGVDAWNQLGSDTKKGVQKIKETVSNLSDPDYLDSVIQKLGETFGSYAEGLLSQVSGLAGSFTDSMSDFMNQYQLGVESANSVARQNAIDANNFTMQLARQQMDFQERMSNTAFQRARADAEAAGFNPILAYTSGPASTPSGFSGSAAQAQSFKSSDLADTVLAIAGMITSVTKSLNSAFTSKRAS